MIRLFLIILINLLISACIYKDSLIEVYELKYQLNLEAIKSYELPWQKYLAKPKINIIKPKEKELKTKQIELNYSYYWHYKNIKIPTITKAPSIKKQPKPNKLIISKKAGVILLGDSLMQGLAQQLCKRLKKEQIPCLNLAKQSSGLLHQRFYNYAATMKAALLKRPAASIIALAGVNDLFDTFYQGKKLTFGSDEWAKRYELALLELKDISAWITLPPLRKDKGAARAKWFNAQIAPILEHLGIRPLRLLEGEFTYYIQHEGNLLKIRANDGIHFSPAGYELMASNLLSQIEFK